MMLSKYLSVLSLFCYAAAVYLITDDKWILAGIAMALGTCLIAVSKQQKEDPSNEA